METFVCANGECGKVTERSTHNQKYCGPECCRIATNARIKEKYHANKARLAGKNRRCDGCGSLLSRYNRGDFCSKCESDNESVTRIKVLEFIGAR